MFLRFWAFVTRREYIAILDHDGEVTFALAKKTPFGLVAKHYSRHVLLLPGGEAVGARYISRWVKL